MHERVVITIGGVKHWLLRQFDADVLDILVQLHQNAKGQSSFWRG
jgi:hypothetical protein